MFKEETVSTMEPETKPANLLVEENLADKYIAHLKQVIVKKKLYLHPEFTIQDMSNVSGIPLHHISNSLNTRLQKNFSEFINEFRIEHAKLILQESTSTKFTMEQIARTCGFGSKTSFNNAFKKHTGITPSEFRKQK